MCKRISLVGTSFVVTFYGLSSLLVPSDSAISSIANVAIMFGPVTGCYRTYFTLECPFISGRTTSIKICYNPSETNYEQNEACSEYNLYPPEKTQYVLISNIAILVIVFLAFAIVDRPKTKLDFVDSTEDGILL